MIARKITLEILTFLIIVLFLYASLTKLFDYQKFVVQVSQSPLLTGLAWIPFVVIVLELTTCVLLILPRLRSWGYFISLGLMGAFTAYIFAILNYSPYVPCSCGGILEKMGWREHLVFNFVFVAFSFAALMLHAEEKREEEEMEFKNAVAEV